MSTPLNTPLTVSEFHAEAPQATASEELAQGPYVADRVGFEIATLHSFIHSGHFYSDPSNALLLRGAPDYSTDTVSDFHAEAHRQLQVKDLHKVPTWRLERESNPRPSG